MNIEERLKDLIVQRYGSVLRFCETYNIPQSTVATIFRRGIAKSNLSSVLSICEALRISADALAAGKILPIGNDRPDSVEEIIENTKNQLTDIDGLTFDNAPADPAAIMTIIQSIDIGVEMARKKKA